MVLDVARACAGETVREFGLGWVRRRARRAEIGFARGRRADDSSTIRRRFVDGDDDAREDELKFA